MSPAQDGLRRGFTLVEVMVALVLLAVGAAGLIELLGEGQRLSAGRRSNEAASRIAETELRSTLVAGAASVPPAGTSELLSEDGTPDPSGPFRVLVQREVTCDPPSALPDDSGSGATPPCTGALTHIVAQVEHLEGAGWTLRASRTGTVPVEVTP